MHTYLAATASLLTPVVEAQWFHVIGQNHIQTSASLSTRNGNGSWYVTQWAASLKPVEIFQEMDGFQIPQHTVQHPAG
ncbi:hypothetical protein B0H16DRAFT_1569376, partial [Mycena metata]